MVGILVQDSEVGYAYADLRYACLTFLLNGANNNKDWKNPSFVPYSEQLNWKALCASFERFYEIPTPKFSGGGNDKSDDYHFEVRETFRAFALGYSGIAIKIPLGTRLRTFFDKCVKKEINKVKEAHGKGFTAGLEDLLKRQAA